MLPMGNPRAATGLLVLALTTAPLTVLKPSMVAMRSESYICRTKLICGQGEAQKRQE